MQIERTVHPDMSEIQAFAREQVPDKPIAMVNLLKFRERADYSGSGVNAKPMTGEQAYDVYGRAVIKHLWRAGGQILWVGNVRQGIIAPSYEHWDRVVLVYYPSRNAFLQMAMSDAYQEIAVHRSAALEDARLFETRAVRLPKLVMRASRLAVRTFGRLPGL